MFVVLVLGILAALALTLLSEHGGELSLGPEGLTVKVPRGQIA
jgi:hypothetical protein